ncbi:hypothetical protein [Myxococcus sp. AB036A]|uniref:hypothetical protein n=1 Tax=Myxococcus sp. AB036A TaxID=2562793 RepID=UPI0011469B4E|nr:hypothetical protein [Myxococcus sp. AB036A]
MNRVAGRALFLVLVLGVNTGFIAAGSGRGGLKMGFELLVVTYLAFIYPALKASSVEPVEGLKAEESGPKGPPSWQRAALEAAGGSAQSKSVGSAASRACVNMRRT